MKFLTLSLAAVGLLAAATPGRAAAPAIELTPLGTYTTGVFDEGAAEIVAHDPGTQRLFVINANAVTVDVLSIANPAAPAKVGSLDATAFGSVATSVSVKDGVVAVSIAGAVPTDAGKVVFFDAKSLKFVNSVTVGVLPDMVTFTKDGHWLLTANEGQPSDDYTIDPEGSVSIVDMSVGAKKLKQANVRNATFTAFNGAILDPSIRIYGKNTNGVASTVAQDLEPEYIAISRDGQTAYVTCQENNAIAIVDIASATVTGLKGLGFKDHSKVDTATGIFEFGAMPSLGLTTAGQEVFLGGFSGLQFEGADPATGNLKFITHTDRGPNGEPFGVNRPFILPLFTPEIVRFELNPTTGAIALTQRIPLKDTSGDPLTGLPNTAIAGGSASTPYNDEVPIDLFGNTLPLDTLGGDFEGIVADPADGSFWMCDEYRPAIYHFTTNGVMIKRFVPIGTAAAAGQPVGTFGDEVLPAVLAQRRQNRGFEALAWSAGKLYAWVQSPLRNPTNAANGALNTNRSVRMVEFNPANNATKQYLYVMDNLNLGGGVNTRADKIGDAVALGGGEFLVVERDDDSVSTVGANLALIEKKIYRLNLAGATDISSRTNLIGGKTIDQLTLAELAANSIVPIGKVLHVDLNAAGYNQVEKVEGLALINQGMIAVINDNDFNISAALINTNSGTFTPDPTPIQLGIISLRYNGLDASDRDNLINIRQWPVLGMYQPDTIAAFDTEAGEFLITANEGDARPYTALNEETRVGSLTLDATAFPFGPALKNNAQLGRLRVTNRTGDTDGDGDFDQLYAYGARSFSIWGTDGSLVFDSRDRIEQLIAANPTLRTNFNANHTANTADDRSDDKGPEPEGVTIGKVAGKTYAFVGLERMSGILVVDLTNPLAPAVVQYVSNRNFAGTPGTPAAGDLGPEGLVFIPSDQSPNGKALLVVGNEVSGSTTIYQINNLK